MILGPQMKSPLPISVVAHTAIDMILVEMGHLIVMWLLEPSLGNRCRKPAVVDCWVA